jgi:hypothetical protein
LNNEKEYFIPFNICIVASCATKQEAGATIQFLKGFSTYYNTLFNAKDALNQSLQTRDKGHKDNFYAPYIPILTYEDQPLGSDLGSLQHLQKIHENGGVGGNRQGSRKPPNSLRNAWNVWYTRKCRILIKSPKGANTGNCRSKSFKGNQQIFCNQKWRRKNKQIFDAYMILAQARIYQINLGSTRCSQLCFHSYEG